MTNQKLKPTPRTDMAWRIAAHLEGEQAAEFMKAHAEDLEAEISGSPSPMPLTGGLTPEELLCLKTADIMADPESMLGVLASCVRRLSGGAGAMTGEGRTLVHNHGPEDGPGLTCPESRLADGTLRGACIGRTGAAGSQGEEA
jgi:hypothetical protein